MEYRNGIFTFQNNETKPLAKLGVDANTLFLVITSMLNTHYDLTNEQIEYAFKSLGGKNIFDAYDVLKENEYITFTDDGCKFYVRQCDKDENVLKANETMLYYRRIGCTEFHFNLYGNSSKLAFDDSVPPQAQYLPDITKPEPQIVVREPRLQPLKIKENGIYKIPTGYDGYGEITVDVRQPVEWRLNNNEVHSVFLANEKFAFFTKYVKGAPMPEDLGENAKKLWNYLVSDEPQVGFRLFTPYGLQYTGMTEEEAAQATAELYRKGYYFEEGEYAFFTDHTINEREWRNYLSKIWEEYDARKARKKIAERRPPRHEYTPEELAAIFAD